MAENGKRLYNTHEELQDALIEALSKRDKERVTAIGLYSLTTKDQYPVDGFEEFDYTDYIWQVASQRLGQLQGPGETAA